MVHQLNNMTIIIADSYEAMSSFCSDIVANQIIKKSNTKLGLATGSTPIGTYNNLVKMYSLKRLNFSEVITFNLDEYCGLGESSEESYAYFMNKHFFNHINVKKDNIYIPFGLAEDPSLECKRYDDALDRLGGLDLQLLGIGLNGHIGFNEPSDVFYKRTHCVKLNSETITANARFFSSPDEVPEYAISMGIKDIMLSSKVILMVDREEKAEIAYKAFFGDITPSIQSSILQLHKDITLILNKPAAKYILKHI